MEQQTTWRLAVVGLMLAGLAACGGGGGSSDGAVRVVNATLAHPSLDLLVNSSVVVPATAKDTVSSYASVASGSPILQVDDAGGSTALTTLAPVVSESQHYTVLVYESSGAVKTSVIGEDTALPVAGTAQMRVFDAAPDAGAVDIYVTDPGADLSTVSAPSFRMAAATAAQASTYLTFAVGTYRIRVTGAGNISDLRLDIPSVTLTSQQLASIIVTSTAGGVLADGGVLFEQGAYSATRNPNARVRLAAAVAGAATVGATSGTAAVSAPTTSPAVGSYVVVPAANGLAVSVNGASVPVPVTSLQPGSDSTLLVYGTAAAPTVTLLADDNHLPAAASTLKMRLVNGVTGAATPLTLEADFGVVAAAVQPGTVSAYGIVTGNATMRLDVTSPSSLTPLYTESNLNIPGAAVFTLFMLGDSSAPAHLLRRDR